MAFSEILIVSAILSLALGMVAWRVVANLRVARGAEGGGCAGGCDCPGADEAEAEPFSV